MIRRINAHRQPTAALRPAQSGFTLVELTISLSFVAFILLFVVFAMVQVMRNYSKGITLKEINQSARTIVEDMSRSARATKASAINVSQLANGRLCLGSVSYVWNVQGGTSNKYLNGSPVTFARATDPSGALCGAGSPPVDPSVSTAILSNLVWVQSVGMTLSTDQALATITLKLSTSGSNAPTVNDPVLGLICSGNINGHYCAVANFSTTVTVRNGQ